MNAKPRKPLLVNLTWAVVALLGLAVLYVLSYAPVYRWRLPDDNPWGIEERLPGYAPVEWLIDKTPLREPLLRWCDLFEIRENANVASLSRKEP